MFLARLLPPHRSELILYQSGLIPLSAKPFSIVHGDAASIDSGSIGAALGSAAGARVIWLRLDDLDDSCEYLAQSFASALQTAAASPRSPGRDLARLLNADSPDAIGYCIARLFEDHTAVVVESSGTGRAVTAALATLSVFTRVASERCAPTVFISHGQLGNADLPGDACVFGPEEIRFDESTGGDLLAVAVPRLGLSTVARMLDVAERRTALIKGVLAAAVCEPAAITSALEQVSSPEELAAQVSGALLDASNVADVRALRVVISLDYWHPRFDEEADLNALRPWVVPIARDWFWLRPMWRPYLREGLDRILAEAKRGPGSFSSIDLSPTRMQAGWSRGRSADLAPESGWDPAKVTAEPAGDRPAADGNVVLSARLLGLFEVRVDTKEVETWEGRLGPMVLKYLLAQHTHSAPRDVLIETFWPGIDPIRGKNRLHVAVSALRRSLETATSVPIVEFSAGRYHISDAVTLELDVDTFQLSALRGRNLEHAGQIPSAITEYELAIHTYGGDFLAESLYEQWTQMPREALRTAYLSVMDQLALLLESTGRHDDCVRVCQRALAEDPCRESAHRLIMRANANLGLPHAALRQFDVCRAILKRELSARPSPETLAAYLTIRDRSKVES